MADVARSRASESVAQLLRISIGLGDGRVGVLNTYFLGAPCSPNMIFELECRHKSKVRRKLTAFAYHIVGPVLFRQRVHQLGKNLIPNNSLREIIAVVCQAAEGQSG